MTRPNKRLMAAIGALPVDKRAELLAMVAIVNALEPLPRDAQARVLLMAITKFAPDGFTDEQLMQLLNVARGKPA